MRLRFGWNVAANMLSAVGGILASLVALPIVLAYLGPQGYGVWTIGLAFIVYLSVADTGFAPAVQRWSALAKGRSDLRAARGLLWTTMFLYVVVGLVLGGALALAAAGIVGIFDFPRPLEGQAVQMFRIIGLVLAVALLAAAVGNVLQGFERFVAIGVSTGLGALVYLGAVVVLLERGAGLVGLAQAALLQQVVTFAARGWAARDIVFTGRPRVLSFAEVRELLVFSAKLQTSVLAWLFNSQSDKIVMGLVAGAATVGQLGIASQVADAGRLVAGAALSPLISSLAVAVATMEPAQLRRHFGWLHRLWLEVIGGGTIIGLALLYPLLRAWLGQGYGEAAVLGVFLVAGMGLALLTGTPVAYMRAVGKPGIEGRYGLVMVVANLGFTIPLALLIGPLGVVAGTLLAYGSAAGWMLKRFVREAPELESPTGRGFVRQSVIALAVGAVAGAAAFVAAVALPTGWSLGVVAAIGLVALTVYVASVTGRRPTPAGLRGLLVDLRQPA